MTPQHVEFMQDLERRFRLHSRLPDRSHYKIFYGPVHRARILLLGINPAGGPSQTIPDDSYFENGEHEILDCEWRENSGLRKVLYPLFDSDSARIRAEVVKTNLVFRRSAKKSEIRLPDDALEARPFLEEIIQRVNPELVLLAGVALKQFSGLFADDSETIAAAERHEGIKQVVFAAERATLRCLARKVPIVQIAHASQFSWTYERYDVASRIRQLQEA